MADINRCPECGTELPADALGGLCPRCLIAAGLESTLSEQPTLPPHKAPTASPAEAATIAQPASAENSALRTPHSELGTVCYFGDYELLEEIARGGMGVVYKARQVSLNRTVALKMILSGQLASAEDVKRFHTEAEAAANLDHPGIVPIFEVGEHQGQHYFSMGYVPGESLAERIARGPLQPKEAAVLVREIAEAVAYAHARGVIHRDLKPGNVLLARSDRLQPGSGADSGKRTEHHTPAEAGHYKRDRSPAETGHSKPKITDFGLAKRVEGDSQLTATGQILGTPSYMPPEQASGKTQEITPAADVYALGAILYACLTSRPPFQADNPLDTLMQVLEREPVSPRQLNPSVPRDLETICLKCLQKDSKRRYESADELAQDLERYICGEPVLAQPITTYDRLAKWARRRPAVAALSMIAIVTATTAFAVVTWQWRIVEQAHASEADARKSAELDRTAAETAARDAIEARNLADSQRRLAEERELIAQRHRYAAQLQLAHQFWKSGYVDRTVETLSRLRPADGEADLRSFDWHYLWRLCITEPLFRVSGFPHGVYCLAVSPDSRWFATAETFGRTVKLWNALTGDLERSFDGHTLAVRALAFSPDSSQLVSAGLDETVRLWDVASGRSIATFHGGSGELWSVAFAPDGKTVAVGGESVRAWDLSQPEPSTAFNSSNAPGSRFFSLAFSPDGRILAGGTSSMQESVVASIEIWQTGSWNKVESIAAHRGQVRSVAFSPDGRWLASGGSDRLVKLWDTSQWSNTATLAGHRGSIYQVCFSGIGNSLASAGWNPQGALEPGELRVWSVEPPKATYALREHQKGVSCVVYSNDGRLLLSAGVDSTVNAWSPDAGQEFSTLRIPTRGSSKTWLSPDGELLAAVRAVEPVSLNGDSIIHVWATQTGRRVRSLEVEALSYDAVALSRDASVAAVGHAEQTALRDLSTGERIAEFGGRASSLTISPGGTIVAMAQLDAESQRGALVLWRTAGEPRRQRLFEFESQSDGISTLEFSPDGAILAVGIARMPGGAVTAHDPEDLLAGGRSIFGVMGHISVELWSTQSGERIGELTGDLPFVHAVVFSPDGDRLLTTSALSREGVLWDIPTLSRVTSLSAHTGPIHSAAFAPDGKTLATGSRDTTIKLWDLETGQERLTLQGHVEAIISLAFSPEGDRLVSASEDGTVNTWFANEGIQKRD